MKPPGAPKGAGSEVTHFRWVSTAPQRDGNASHCEREIELSSRSSNIAENENEYETQEQPYKEHKEK